ncbi:hypothetical protein QBC33DRAFT_560226 [Phialemonium atrogriseum]|uniref:Uncharacterized protein n=1 Tax=Phialemonium atrogriseum TaxID=1093897 RepID=A0AAJ0BXJ3_9PEZI|nr:uncharacterized protein QBC33DRAFT_560226 [Phialemonium atrogriseum]KAK1766325.1 hypothetical protein QBC33DRAFT_560226 [Phialemonium atrogriseum]
MTNLASGDGKYYAIVRAINLLLQIVFFAPLAVVFICIISHNTNPSNPANAASYTLVATSMAAFLSIPLGTAAITRFSLHALAGLAWYYRVFLPATTLWLLVGLLYTPLRIWFLLPLPRGWTSFLLSAADDTQAYHGHQRIFARLQILAFTVFALPASHIYIYMRRASGKGAVGGCSIVPPLSQGKISGLRRRL